MRLRLSNAVRRTSLERLRESTVTVSECEATNDEAKKQDWTVISMKNDWKHIFAFEN